MENCMRAAGQKLEMRESCSDEGGAFFYLSSQLVLSRTINLVSSTHWIGSVWD